jgi:hypothetical protein
MTFIFKTSVKTNRQVLSLKSHIHKMLPKGKWNFDLEDCDTILRIDNEENVVSSIINLLKSHNFYFTNLE